MSQENVTRFYRAVDAVRRRDLDAYLVLLDADVDIAPLGTIRPSYHGHDGVRRWWEDLFGVAPDFSLDIGEVRDQGDLLVVALRVHAHGRGSGVPVDQSVWQVVKFRHEKVLWWRSYGSESEALEAVGLSD
jgi:ketosteroid isomerase-like protein